MAQSLFKILQSESPHRPLDVLAPAWSLPIVARMPEIRAGIASETAHGEVGIGKRRKIARELRNNHYGSAIVLPRSIKAALIPWFANIPVRTGYRGESRYWLINDVHDFDAERLDQTVKRFAALGLPHGQALDSIPFPALDVSADRQQQLIDELALDTAKPIVAMMPGAEYGPAKCWPLPKFAELAQELEVAGYSVWIFGSEKDAVAGEEVATDNNAVNLCGKTQLVDVVDLLALCQSAVSNDSGLMHIAAAVGIEVHGIYGSSSPLFTPPLTQKKVIHTRNLECSPCFKRECPLEHLRCLKEISAQDVLSRIT